MINNSKFKEVAKIYETTDYGMFSFFKLNRKANPRKDLLDALEENGRFYEPIMVDEQYRVLDGQHRLLSAKLKKAPITFYVVDDTSAIEVIKSVNTDRNDWTVRQHIDLYEELGYQDYITLNEYLHSDVSSIMSDSTIFEVLGNKKNLSSPKEIKKGNFEVGNTQEADRIFDYIKLIRGNRSKKIKRSLVRVLMQLDTNKDIDNDRVVRVLSNDDVYETVQGFVQHKHIIDYLMSIYNKGMSTNFVEYYFDSSGKFQTL